MSLLRIYRKFYIITTSPNNGDDYNLIDPINLSAETYISGTGNTQSNTLIESGINIIQEESGIYYANLNPTLYAIDFNYDLVWYVQYTNEAPLDKKLVTRFRVKPYNIAAQLDYEINNIPIEYEILGTYN